MKEIIEIDGVKYVDYTESDLRFTGWKHECIIIDRNENHYLIPLNRFEELNASKKKIEPDTPKGVSGCAGPSGTVSS